MSINDPPAEGDADAPSAFAYHFPPFPQPLPGRELPSFDQFISGGIVLSVDASQPQLDALGIPTIKLRVKHAHQPGQGPGTEGGKKKKKKKKQLDMKDDQGKQLQWWEIWAEDEDQRGPGQPYDKAMDDAECLHQAAADFFSSRKWPQNDSIIHPVWTHIRLFIGCETMASANSKRPPHHPDSAEPPVDDMDDEDEEWGVNATKPTGEPQLDDGILPTLPDSGIQELIAKDEDDEEFELTAEETRTANFLQEPAYHIRMFFSSYYIDRGLIWDPHKCREGAKLVTFFINFILRNRLLRSSHTNLGLREALKVCEVADLELPAIRTTGEALAVVKISEALLNLWGKKWLIETLRAETPPPRSEDVDVMPTVEEEVELIPDVMPIDEEEFLADAPAREAMKDNIDGEEVSDVLDREGAHPPSTDTDTTHMANGWGSWGSSAPAQTSTEAGWGIETSQDADGQAWASAHLDQPSGWGNDTAPAATKDANMQVEEDTWAVYQPLSLISLMGPTNLPVTHHAGIVEQSTRRVKAVLPPAAEDAIGAGDSASAVESNLRSHFARVIFGPWTAGSDALALRKGIKPDVVAPTILSTSVGRAFPDVPGHNPEKDDIEVLMDTDVTQHFITGMGFRGTWVSMAREGDQGGEEGRLWYMEYVSQFVPSFYVDTLY